MTAVPMMILRPTPQEKAVSYVGMYPEDEEAAKELDFLKSRTGSNE